MEFKKVALSLSAVAVMTGLFVNAEGSAQAMTPRDCAEVEVPVALARGSAKTERIAGQFCKPAVWDGERKIDVLVAGTSYDRNYWDFGYDPSKYSYVNKTLAEGRATFALDRLGTGKSSRPLSMTFTATNSAHSIHEVIQWLRHHKKFDQIHLVGHSLGSAIIIEEAATYGDVDKLVLTGFSNMLNIGNSLPGVLGLRPAMLDPVLRDKGYVDLGYMTTAPSTRPDIFYGTPENPAVIAYDEAHKSAFSATELATGLASLELPAPLNISRRVTAPTLIITGSQDKVFCGGLVDCESARNFTHYHQPYFDRAASFTAATVPDTGHALTTVPSAQRSFRVINNWLIGNSDR